MLKKLARELRSHPNNLIWAGSCRWNHVRPIPARLGPTPLNVSVTMSGAALGQESAIFISKGVQ
ncbi:hypothetical protein CPB86DRAFT_792124 [Serendipita vermifera]|nr:hypothetical protein CPB86DRAFT_792124 [Serendipita vermifera]